MITLERVDLILDVAIYAGRDADGFHLAPFEGAERAEGMVWVVVVDENVDAFSTLVSEDVDDLGGVEVLALDELRDDLSGPRHRIAIGGSGGGSGAGRA